jgi:hypothetical protein
MLWDRRYRYMLFFKGKVVMKAWFADLDLLKDWLFAVSNNG